MNDLFVLLGIASWKPVLTALVLPPLPLILLALVGARLIAWRRGVGWTVLVAALAGVWLSGCMAVGDWLERVLLHPPPALDAAALDALKRDAARQRKAAVIVLGAGRERFAPEYGMSNLAPLSMERLRYGVWLGRETGVPVGFSGGIGHSQLEGPTEAEIAARIAAREFGRPLRWLEPQSRDTRENARYTIALLKADGISKVVLVTHGFHMPRAQRAFEDAAAPAGITVVPAPMGLARASEGSWSRWMPSHQGSTAVRLTLHEALGLLAGA